MEEEGHVNRSREKDANTAKIAALVIGVGSQMEFVSPASTDLPDEEGRKRTERVFHGLEGCSRRLIRRLFGPWALNCTRRLWRSERNSILQCTLVLADGVFEKKPVLRFIYRPDRPNRRGPVPVYRSGLAGNRSEPFEVKFEFKNLSSTVLYRYTGRFGRYTGDLKKFSDG